MADVELVAQIPGHHSGADIEGAINGNGVKSVRIGSPSWGQGRSPETWAWAVCEPNAALRITGNLHRRFPGTHVVERLKK